MPATKQLVASIDVHVRRQAKIRIVQRIERISRIACEIRIHLEAEGAEARVVAGVSMVCRRIIMDYQSSCIMRRNILSVISPFEEYMKEPLEECSAGLIKVEKNAQNTNSYFRDDVLLLDDGIAESLPTLEIEANEVKASHGSTTSRINEEQLFYLQSRGISKLQARQMIIDGFLRVDSEYARLAI